MQLDDGYLEGFLERRPFWFFTPGALPNLRQRMGYVTGRAVPNSQYRAHNVRDFTDESTVGVVDHYQLSVVGHGSVSITW